MSLFQANIIIQVSTDGIFTEHKDIAFLPSVFIDKKELFFGQFSGKDKLTVVGLAKVLSQIEVSRTNYSIFSTFKITFFKCFRLHPVTIH